MKSSAAALLAALTVAGATFAQDPAAGYPHKVLRVIVPFPAGGTADVLTRIIGEKLAAKAEPDGYTLLSTPPPPLVINPSLYAKLAFDPAQFVPVAVVAAVPNVLLVHPSLPVTTLKELIALAKQKAATPGRQRTGGGSR